MDLQSYMAVPPGIGMEENFFSLDDILLSHERLPCRTESAFPRLGFLEKSSETRDIPEGTKMEMPLWLAKGLYERKRRVLSVELPKVYREGWRTVFGADPIVVDLHKMGPYYYGLGSQMLHFDSPENPEIANTILQTFMGRFRRTMDSSQNAYNEDTSALVERLDCLERSLFKAGQSGLNSFQLWEKGRSSHLTASSLVINYRKRKIADLQA
ncbi:LOW QUALITY PROTEIN: DNA replication complex GINS protein PSF3-like [Sinocyclocheilus grahami]|uniref:LOW QUALITY PROTEIN: DNA replication complex GINS protein PSF3-like n=1 Tax=Sinocyclocheilus grahami TaxID=75366 RepID=UPI0007AD378F|nr:PREDICTED: LOW QUALITY PROTEIN: DNA replication complex GINS protein PSF3-like [Sinocyclocheilus grahami]